MTKEELKKEADDYADKHAFRVPYDGSNKFYDDVDFKASKEGYLAGAEPREKRIKHLEESLLDVTKKSVKRIEELEKENKALRDNYDQFKAIAEPEIERLKKENAELKEELKNWKDEWQEQVQKAIDEGYARTLQTIHLTKATALLKKFIETSNPIYFDEDRQKVKVEAEQFLKGVNIILEDAQVGNSPFDADKVFNKEMKAYPEEK